MIESREKVDKEECILIVDDDECTCKSLALIFSEKGYETETAYPLAAYYLSSQPRTVPL